MSDPAAWQMPVRYMTYPNEPRSILPVDRRTGGARSASTVRLDASYLASYGTMRVPTNPNRDGGVARERAGFRSGKRLTAANVDIDHCFPWAVWPCSDLWNLMPAHRAVNQREKRDRLPTDRLLRAAQDRILQWWNDAYRENANRALAERFALEASVSLPGVAGVDADLDNFYSAVNLQRLRLKQNQQVPEWSGERYL